ncbi:MAG: sensor histidine kinase [Nocardioides sp.]|uniref:sensor histidine kinase n=1 Tax=Nocardioides sp. TaxID=35761 RepID=UPI003F038EA2
MSSTMPWTMGPRLSRWFDRALVVLLAGLSVLGYGVAGDHLLALLCLLQIAPLWWRRTHPTWVFVAVAAASALQVPLTDQPIVGQIAFPIAAYSVSRWGSRTAAWSALGVTFCAALVAAYDWTAAYTPAGQLDPSALVAPTLSSAGIAATAWAFGLAGSQRDRFVASLVDRADQAQRMAERDVALAAQDERARIAREMHDVVAHGLSVIVVQADGARYAAAKDPQVAVDTLETVAATGRDSLAEMRRLLGLLRTGDSGVLPQPVLADIEHLLDEARAGGTLVEADLPAEWPEVPGGVGLAAYRVVQEALTNVRKHAGPGARVQVLVRTGPAGVRLEVRDDGRGAAAGSDGHGLGLRGMRERVDVHGGTLEAGPAPGGGWLVSARIPL